VRKCFCKNKKFYVWEKDFVKTTSFTSEKILQKQKVLRVRKRFCKNKKFYVREKDFAKTKSFTN